jgi:hypothetical protein
LAHAVDDYIKLLRGLGFKLKDHEDYLRKFVAFLEEFRLLPERLGVLFSSASKSVIFPLIFGLRSQALAIGKKSF